jgi:hydrogenase/urease accessory protein HupE
MATQHGQGEGIAAGVEHPLAGRDHHHGQLDMK